MSVTPSDDDLELAAEFLNNRSPSPMTIAKLIYEVRTEQQEFDAAICEEYAEVTDYSRKALGAKECAARIRRGPATGSRGEEP